MPVSSASTLHYADLREWRSDPDYAPLVAAILRDAYDTLFRNPNSLPAAYKAFAIASQSLKESMCLQQRMNLLYVMAQSAREMGEAAMALQMLDSALTDSVVLHDRRSTAELLYISGNIKRAYMRPHAALSDLLESRLIIDDLKGSRNAVEPHLELGVVHALSGVAFFQARYMDALPLLDEAQSLHLASRDPGVQQDRISWMRAVNLRYLGRAEEALAIFEDIAKRIDTMENPAVFTRLYAALSDAALDLAETARDRGEGREMNRLLVIAQQHAMEGIHRSDAEFDEGGGMLARLAIVRQSQFMEKSDTRRRIIADVWRFAESSDEHDVMAQARCALAREFVAQGDYEAARNLLLQVVGRSAISEVPYTGEPSKALLRHIGWYEN